MRKLITLCSFMALLLTPAVAQQESEGMALGSDRFLAGRNLIFDGVGVDDLFMAGELVRSEAEISGSAHLAGRRVELFGAVGGDVYMAGMSLALGGSVVGDATLAGYDVRVGAVGGDLRVTGDTLIVMTAASVCSVSPRRTPCDCTITAAGGDEARCRSTHCHRVS